METLVKTGSWVVANWSLILNAVIAFLMAVIAVATMIKGDEPEKTLQKIVDYIKKISAK